jgi:hypothetical protein
MRAPVQLPAIARVFREGDGALDMGQAIPLLRGPHSHDMVLPIGFFGHSGAGKSTQLDGLLSRSPHGATYLQTVDGVALHGVPFEELFPPGHAVATTKQANVGNFCVPLRALLLAWGQWNALSVDEQRILSNVYGLFVDFEGWNSRNEGGLRATFATMMALSPLRLLFCNDRVEGPVDNFITHTYMAEQDARDSRVEIGFKTDPQVLVVLTKVDAQHKEYAPANVAERVRNAAVEWQQAKPGERTMDHIRIVCQVQDKHVSVTDYAFTHHLESATARQASVDAGLAQLSLQIGKAACQIVPSLPYDGGLLARLFVEMHAATLNLAPLEIRTVITQHRQARTSEWFDKEVADPSFRESVRTIAKNHWHKPTREVAALQEISSTYTSKVQGALTNIWGGGEPTLDAQTRTLLQQMLVCVCGRWVEELTWRGDATRKFCGFQLARGSGLLCDSGHAYELLEDAVALSLDSAQNPYTWGSSPTRWSSGGRTFKSFLVPVAQQDRAGTYLHVVVSCATGAILGRVREDGLFEQGPGVEKMHTTDEKARDTDYGRVAWTRTFVTVLPTPFAFNVENRGLIIFP